MAAFVARSRRCPVCLDLASKDLEDFPDGRPQSPLFTRDINDLYNSAQGCDGCSILLEGISCFIPSRNAVSSVFVSLQSDIGPLHLQIWTDTINSKTIQFYTCQPEISPWPMIGPDHPRASCDISSDLAFSKILGWIHECTGNHSRCGKAKENPIPARVLDLGTSENDMVKLYETCDEQARYVCLSHCWGRVPFLTTTKANLRTHTTGIPWSSFTKTFQDAIMVTRRLGIRWLWIDSFCIIQDDPRDWDRESANMASIYANSYITIAATSSADGSGGLFSAEMDCELIRSSANGMQYSIHVRNHDYLHWYNSHAAPPTDTFPLLHRGWCYQERLLSSRVLHFGRQEVMWECKTASHCECGSFNRGTNPKIDLDKALFRQDVSQLRFAWRTVVCEYSRLALTKPSDRLPALSGLAKLMRMNRAMSDYLAGMWKQTLLEDLSWYAVTENPAVKADPWRAPSWSWAAADAEIKFASIRNGVWHATVLKAYCKPSGSDPTGRVSEGSLVINGPLVPADLQLRNEVEHGCKYSLMPCAKPELEAEASLAALPQWRHVVRADHSLPEEADERARSPAIRVYCLGLVTDNKHEYIEPYFFKGNYYKHGTYYLILRCIDETSQVYERIGLAWQEESFPGAEEKLGSRDIKRMRQGTLSQTGSGNLFADTRPDSVITIL